MILGLVALILPLTPTLAGTPTLSVSPTAGQAGQGVQVIGSGLTPRAVVEMLWDGSQLAMPTTKTTGNGSFKLRMTVPKDASAGAHMLGARIQQGPTRASVVPGPSIQTVSTVFVVATGTVTDPPSAGPTADPTTVPTAPAVPPTPAPPAATPIPDPTAAPTPRPTNPPAPTPDPTPRPTPAPTPRPTPVPTPPAPTGCDAVLGAGSGDRTADLRAIIASVPNGSTICFAPATYVVNGRVPINSRSGLTFVGPATIKTTTTDRGNLSLFQPYRSTSIVFRDLVLEGGRPDPGKYWPAHEFEFAVDFRGSSGTVNGVTMKNWGGDAVYVGYVDSASSSRSHDVTVKNSVIDGTGRMGVAITAGTNIQILGNSLNHIALAAIDLETDYATHTASDVVVANNTVRRYGMDPHLSPWFFQSDANVGTSNNLTIRDNTFIGSALTVEIGRWSPTRRANVTITGNTSDINGTSPFGSGGALMYLWHIDGLTVSGNTQGVAAGSVKWDVKDCTSASVH